MNDIEQRITKLLTDLGSTIQKVAATLQRLGITGTPGATCDCPVAKYLDGNGIPISYVSSMQVVYAEGDRFGVHVPRAVGDFIVDFDENPDIYPELVEVRA